MQASRCRSEVCNFIKIRDSGAVVFLWILRIFKNSFSPEHLRATASGLNVLINLKPKLFNLRLLGSLCNLNHLSPIIYHQMKISKKYNEQVFYKKVVLKNFAIFTEKHLRWSLFLNKNTVLQTWNFFKKRLQHRFFPVNIAKFLRKPVLENICERLSERLSNINNIGIEEDIFSKIKHGNWRRIFSQKQNMGIKEDIFSKKKKKQAPSQEFLRAGKVSTN